MEHKIACPSRRKFLTSTKYGEYYCRPFSILLKRSTGTIPRGLENQWGRVVWASFEENERIRGYEGVFFFFFF